MMFILVHFDEISRTAGFEEMGRTNVELGIHIRQRFSYILILGAASFTQSAHFLSL